MMQTLEQWNAGRSKIATNPDREERLRQKASRRGVIPVLHSACNNIALAEAKRQEQNSGSKKTGCKNKSKNGVGDCLKRMLQGLGIPSGWCDGCTQRAAAMNQWGADGCRQNRATIVGWLIDAEGRYAAASAKMLIKEDREPTEAEIRKAMNAERWRVAWEAAKQLTWINPLDPFGNLIDRAIVESERMAMDGEGDDECLCQSELPS